MKLTASRLVLSLSAVAVLGLALSAAAQDSGRSYGNINEADLPPNARPGECYARVYMPPQFRAETEQVLKRGAGERLEIVPARYETVTEEILVKPASMRLVEVPARYDWEEQTVLTAEGRTEWKKGPCDPKRQLANATGECLCLVQIPPRYETVRRKVMTNPPSTRTVDVPAQYKTIKKTVMTRPPEERRIAIPAEYTTVGRRVQTSDAHMKWQIIDCEYGGPVIDRDTAMLLQRTLKAKGHDPGPIDGIFGAQTRAALQSFQRASSLPLEGLGEKTRKALGM